MQKNKQFNYDECEEIEYEPVGCSWCNKRIEKGQLAEIDGDLLHLGCVEEFESYSSFHGHPAPVVHRPGLTTKPI